MSKMQALRALVAERLAAAAVEIVGAVETNFTLTEKKMLHKEGMLPDQQRALVHKRLMMVADEIFGILKIMMGEYEAKIACSHQETDCQHKLLDITLKSETSLHRADRLPQSFSSCEKNVSPEQQTSRVQQGPGPPHIKEVSTQSDFEFISQMQRAEKGTSTEKMDSDQEAVSSKHSVA
ncbi:hypothetical protein LDENG_00117650 [Lucifuga dentata]|nr:hypothetical protein LDENG_00117650 [Lucifuga dentata]